MRQDTIKYLEEKKNNKNKKKIKYLEENIGRTDSDIYHSNIFFDPPSRIMEIKINKYN